MESAEIDSELSEIDVRIDQLRALYEQYFMGMERMEPQKPRQEVERRLKVLRKEQIRNTAQRFKFNVLVQRLNTMQQYWGRVVREIENGTFKRDLVKAAARFGDGALTGVAKKRAKELSKLAAAQAKRPAAVDQPGAGPRAGVDDMVELGAEDLIEDEELDETPTPPRPAQAIASTRGLLPADLPLIATSRAVAPPASTGGRSAPRPIVEAAASAVHAVDPEARHLAPAASGDAPPPSRRAGLRWGSSDPSSAIRAAPLDVKRRVAELAAEMRKTKGPGDDGPSFGALDLDFEDAPSSRPAADPTPLRTATPARSLPSPPVVRGPAGPLPAAPGVPGAPPSSPVTGSFGVLDMPFDSDDTAPPLPSASSPGSPGSGIRAGAGRPQPRPLAPVPPPVARPRPEPAAPVPAASGLGDQRMRQIYAKYVETKRAANESTAGVTYEKLAATLRAQADKLRAQHPTKAIDYDVVIKDGKTHIKPVLR